MHLAATALNTESLRPNKQTTAFFFENVIQRIIAGAGRTTKPNEGIGEASQRLAAAENHPSGQVGETV